MEYACIQGASAARGTKSELNLAVLQPMGNVRLRQEQRGESQPAQQADLGGSAVPSSCFLCLEAGRFSSPRYLGHLLGAKEL